VVQNSDGGQARKRCQLPTTGLGWADDPLREKRTQGTNSFLDQDPTCSVTPTNRRVVKISFLDNSPSEVRSSTTKPWPSPSPRPRRHSRTSPCPCLRSPPPTPRCCFSRAAPPRSPSPSRRGPASSRPSRPRNLSSAAADQRAATAQEVAAAAAVEVIRGEADRRRAKGRRKERRRWRRGCPCRRRSPSLTLRSSEVMSATVSLSLLRSDLSEIPYIGCKGYGILRINSRSIRGNLVRIVTVVPG
jgi:hypothetical protein